jgi:hypothetical protein
MVSSLEQHAVKPSGKAMASRARKRWRLSFKVVGLCYKTKRKGRIMFFGKNVP